MAKFFSLCVSCELVPNCSFTLARQFKLGDYVPDDSYLKETLYSFERYSSVVRPVGVYFRNMDQTDPDTQQQMIHYVESLEELEQFSSSSARAKSSNSSSNMTAVAEYPNGDMAQDINPCWVRDFYQLKDEILAMRPGLEFLENMTFIDQLNLALADPLIREIYGQGTSSCLVPAAHRVKTHIHRICCCRVSHSLPNKPSYCRYYS